MTFFSALILGLLASAHCAGMCGPLQSVLQQPMVIRSNNQAIRHLLLLNTGRLMVYTAAGFVFATFGSTIVSIIDVPYVTRAARYFTGAVLLLIGLQLLITSEKPFLSFEKLGAPLWKKISTLMPNQSNNRASVSLSLGMAWGFLPCGLIYGVLMTSVFADTGLSGGLVMLGFGIGTLPSLILSGGLYMQLRSFFNKAAVRVVGGLFFIQGGILVMLAPHLVNMDFKSAYPQLMMSMFCLS